MPVSEAKRLIDETEEIFNRFGMDAEVYPTDMDAAKSIRREAKKHGIDLLLIKQKHLGRRQPAATYHAYGGLYPRQGL